MSKKVFLMIIDPQNDFMDQPGAGLPVPGATADMDRLAKMITRLDRKIDDIYVTLDSHHLVDVGHPAMWQDEHGNPPAPFTVIMAADIRSGRWTPRNANAKPAILGGETIRDYFIRYAETLEAKGQYVLMVWSVHCLIGSKGQAVYAPLMKSLNAWADHEFANVNWITKGTNPWTEHYGGLEAEVPMPSDPSTGLNVALLDALQEADIIAFAGEAASHCVLSTVQQVVDNVDPKLLKKMHLLTDCMSPIPAVPGGPDFPAITSKWMKDMQKRGMVLTTSSKFLA